MLKRGRKPDMDRRHTIVRMRERGMTLQDIGDALVPPVTREAVRQQLVKNSLDMKEKVRYK